MTSNQERADLLESLKRLFTRVMALHAEGRARSSSNNMMRSQNIVTPLSEYIDKLAANAGNKPADTINSQIPESATPSHGHPSFSQEPSSRKKSGELTRHLKELHKHSGASLDTGDRLMHSTWEHFHTAIRLGRQGDIKAARVHIELTRNALNEAARYLPDSVYSSFAIDVMKALEQINDHETTGQRA
jgi:hypothetical protein